MSEMKMAAASPLPSPGWKLLIPAVRNRGGVCMAASGDRSHFKVLSVDRGANADAIKRAFRKLARQNHLDVNPGVASAEERSYNLVK